ncbi:MAG: signal peptidase I [Treponema sp.]|nr:signal peptidase I [Treponema sp.]
MGKAIFAAFMTAVVIKLFVFDVVIAEGNSMEPTIRSGSVLIVNRLQYGFRFPGQKGLIVQWANPREGDVVVFFTPMGYVAVKRATSLLEGGMFMAEGDNYQLSYDSRSFGPVSVDAVIGRVLGIR